MTWCRIEFLLEKRTGLTLRVRVQALSDDVLKPVHEHDASERTQIISHMAGAQSTGSATDRRICTMNGKGPITNRTTSQTGSVRCEKCLYKACTVKYLQIVNTLTDTDVLDRNPELI